MAGYHDLDKGLKALVALMDFLSPNMRESDVDYLEKNIQQGIDLKNEIGDLNVFADLEAIYFEQGEEKTKKLIARIKISYRHTLLFYKRYYNLRAFEKAQHKLLLYKTIELKRLVNYCFHEVHNVISEIMHFENHYFKGTSSLNSKTTKPDYVVPFERSIQFKIKETTYSLFELLKEYFADQEDVLIKALQGEELPYKLFFPHNQNRLVEVFRRLQYNGFLLSTNTEIKDWLCNNFTFRSTNHNHLIKPFNPSTVWDILSKGKGEPPKKGRLCDVEWLPYQNPSKVKDLAQKERL